MNVIFKYRDSSIVFFFIFSIVSLFAQEKDITYNLDFEGDQETYLDGWEIYGSDNYVIRHDSTYVTSGQYSTSIEFVDSIKPNSEVQFKGLGMKLPNYDGETIKLTGYIKSENVSDGFAGLWIRVDPGVAFENMQNRGIKGTTDWTKYEITLPLSPRKSEGIFIGVLSSGKGKIWIDDLKIYIDDKSVQFDKLDIYEQEILPAELDTVFSKSSGISISDVNNKQIENLSLLGKVWGFLKYHHKKIGNGQYNWDNELFRFLPNYLKVRNKIQRDSLIIRWINGLGKLEPCTSCVNVRRDAALKPDHDWIDSEGITDQLRFKLKEVYEKRFQGIHYYVELNENAANPKFQNEKRYPDFDYVNDDGYKLLSLFRYWNIIKYFFPYRHLIDNDWDSLLNEYIPRFLEVNNELEYELIALRLIGEAKDTHANLWGGNDKIEELRGRNFAPFRGGFVENKFIITDFYNPELIKSNELSIGDIITHINGKKISTLVDSLNPYYPASNNSARLRDMSKDLLRSSEKSMNLTYIHKDDGKPHNLVTILKEKDSIDMYEWYDVYKKNSSYEILKDSIGYITLGSIKNYQLQEIKRSFKDLKGIIVDIRNYPSDFVPFSLGSYLISEPKSFVKFSQANPNNPGEFKFVDGATIKNDENYFQGNVVILVDEKTQSQAEYTAMALRQGDKAIVMGSTTAGADGNTSSIYLPGNLRTLISGIGVYYPDGQETQRKGIIPDIIVEPTIESVRNQEDKVLNEAIDYLSKLN